jgi:membrane fusion protein, heavy metal efflux system
MPRNLLFILPSILLICCGNPSGNKPFVTNEQTKDSILITPDLAANSQIQVGHLSKRTMPASIHCCGSVDLPSTKVISISAPMAGFIKSARYNVGDYVEKGSIMVTLEHPNYIMLQQEYLEAKSQLELYTDDYKRQGDLTLENAASIKTMQKAKADFAKAESRVNELKVQLHFLGINPEDISENNISSTIQLKALTSGYVSQTNANIGKLANCEEPIYQIINENSLQLLLQVNEIDASSLAIGQIIHFTIGENSPKVYNAKLAAISPMINTKTKMLDVSASIVKPHPFFRIGTSVSATILNPVKEVWCLPSASILKRNKLHSIYLKSGKYYIKNQVNTGVENKEWTEIANPTDSLIQATIIINGTTLFGSVHQR